MNSSLSLTQRRITVVGLGLMGASLAASMRGRCARVTGVDLRADTVRKAVERGLVDEATLDLEGGLKEADVVILAAPVRAIIKLLETIPEYIKEGALVMDLGSTKTGITQKMNSLPEHVDVIGGHPMCGKESSGIEAADSVLYGNALFFLVPLERTRPNALALATALVQDLKARPYVIDAERHDRLVAAVSHLPYMLACGLVRVADEVAAQDSLIWQTASSGFRDTSRLAASNVTMMMDILITNREAVMGMLAAYQRNLADFSALLTEENEEELKQVLLFVQDRRKKLF